MLLRCSLCRSLTHTFRNVTTCDREQRLWLIGFSHFSFLGVFLFFLPTWSRSSTGRSKKRCTSICTISIGRRSKLWGYGAVRTCNLLSWSHYLLGSKGPWEYWDRPRVSLTKWSNLLANVRKLAKSHVLVYVSRWLDRHGRVITPTSKCKCSQRRRLMCTGYDTGALSWAPCRSLNQLQIESIRQLQYPPHTTTTTKKGGKWKALYKLSSRLP